MIPLPPRPGLIPLEGPDNPPRGNRTQDTRCPSNRRPGSSSQGKPSSRCRRSRLFCRPRSRRPARRPARRPDSPPPRSACPTPPSPSPATSPALPYRRAPPAASRSAKSRKCPGSHRSGSSGPTRSRPAKTPRAVRPRPRKGGNGDSSCEHHAPNVPAVKYPLNFSPLPPISVFPSTPSSHRPRFRHRHPRASARHARGVRPVSRLNTTLKYSTCSNPVRSATR